MSEQTKFGSYYSILQEELILAQGCTEPIAIAYASATAAKVLAHRPERLLVACSGNIFKNVQSVIIPGTGTLTGVAAAAVLGAVAGNADLTLEVLRDVTQRDVQETTELLAKQYCKTKLIDDIDVPLVIRITAQYGEECAEVTVMHTHTNIVQIKKNGKILKTEEEQKQEKSAARDELAIRGILEFAKTVSLEAVRPLLQRQIENNLRIAEEGLHHKYGANVGQMLLASARPEDARTIAIAYAAAGSDARMAGCELPVVINSGSGNQGITVSLPVVMLARAWGKTEEELLRALVVSNLTAVRIKHNMGSLSAFCGAVSAACGAGAGLAYLKGFDEARVGATITNMLANISGLVCDGAKASCAAKIASAVSASFLALDLAEQGFSFAAGDGFVGRDVEETIDNISTIVKNGMRSMDKEILKVMLQCG
jgi:L-cysteine desulfidase